MVGREGSQTRNALLTFHGAVQWTSESRSPVSGAQRCVRSEEPEAAGRRCSKKVVW